ncbi:MAG: alanine racemase [Clostridia bacterium]|nr:alanine racemase [Clostridia bacterium]
MEPFFRRTWADIDLDAVRDNYRYIRSRLAADCRLMAVVKADAYGHCVQRIAQVYNELGAEWFAVSNLEEALQLRQMGLSQRILILSYTPPKAAALLAEQGITTAVVSREHAEALNQAAAAAGVNLTVHIKVDTGMTRVGLRHDEDILAVCRLPHVNAEGIFTHFATADTEDEAFVRTQFAAFMAHIAAAEQAGITFPLRHCCNSAATLRYPDMHLDMVRPGIILYGCMPDGSVEPNLRPVMSLKTAVSQVKSIEAGETVSYGRTFTAPGRMQVATVPIGYADGYSRLFSNRAPMLVKGNRACIVGNVCMDQTVLDITNIEDVEAGTTVTVFGKGLPVEELAALAGTISYELLCLVGKRVPRVFWQNNEIVGAYDGILP